MFTAQELQLGCVGVAICIGGVGMSLKILNCTIWRHLLDRLSLLCLVFTAGETPFFFSSSFFFLFFLFFLFFFFFFFFFFDLLPALGGRLTNSRMEAHFAST
jgi:hypothetical protein